MNKTYVTFLVAALAMPCHALATSEQTSGNDSSCVEISQNTLHNQCSYAVDVSFCVESPMQTKNFFDNSDAFKCPNGGLSTLGPGKSEGNILHGRIHWFACSTKYRGKGSWKYHQGSGYRGYCHGSPATNHSGDLNADSPNAANLKHCKLENFVDMFKEQSLNGGTPEGYWRGYKDVHRLLIERVRNRGAGCSNAADLIRASQEEINKATADCYQDKRTAGINCAAL